MAQRLDAEKLRLIGEPHALADPAATVSAGSRVLVYGSSIAQRQFKWFDRKGNESGFWASRAPGRLAAFRPMDGESSRSVLVTTRASGCWKPAAALQAAQSCFGVT
jgi:hypothetical protein